MSVSFETESARIALGAVSSLFASLGRHLLCLDETFRVVYASPAMREILGGEMFGPLDGRPVADLLGKELFGVGAPLREALAAGERREGWRVLLQTTHGIRPLSITAAPLLPDPSGVLDPRIRYLIVILPAEEDHFAASSAPTVLSGLIARSPAMSKIFQLVENLQSSEAPVLVCGEGGTGKDVVARAIHEHSPRRRGPFVTVNCSTLPPDLLASELFGHVQGAFPGAVRDRVGRFELAARGTLFLDDCDLLTPNAQARLLRVLENKTYERVGESVTRAADARVIVATCANLEAAVEEGSFRRDLYNRLRAVPIELPPLRTRREDIEPLARLLLRRVGERHGRQVRLSPEVIRVFLNYSWPGNVQELETAIEYAVAVTRGAWIQPEDLPAEMLGPPLEAASPQPVADSEGVKLRAALETHRWRREETARALGISRATLWRRMREHGLL